MSKPLEFIGALLRTGNLTAIREFAITPAKLNGGNSEMASGEAALILTSILQYSAALETYGRVPSREWVQRLFPVTTIPDTTADPMVLAREIDTDFKVNKVNGWIDNLGDVARKHGIDAALGYLSQELHLLIRTGTRKGDMLLEQALQSVIEGYAELETHEGFLGLPWRWDCLNQDTNGMMDGFGYTFYGPMKSMKTWIALAQIAHLHENSDARILMFLKEMMAPRTSPSGKDMGPIILWRLAALLARVNYKAFKNGKLKPEERDRAMECLSGLRDTVGSDPSKSRLILLRETKALGVGALRAKIREYDAKVVFVDSIYKMADDKSKGKTGTDVRIIGNISEDWQEMLVEERVIGITTTQENEMRQHILGKKSPSTLMYATKLGQDTDMLIRIQVLPNGPDGKPRRGFVFPATRDDVIRNFTIKALPAEDFEYDCMGVKDKDLDDSPSKELPVGSWNQMATATGVGFVGGMQPAGEA